MLKKLVSSLGCTNSSTTLESEMELKRVCVIGAGAAGLIAIHHIKNDPNLEGIVFEQSDTVGGIWNYTEHTGQNEFGLPIHSTAYKGLRTNLPKEIMGFLEYPFPLSSHSYVSHTEVLNYLRRFAHEHSLENMIKFTTRVIKVEWLDSKWKVTTEDLRTKDTKEHYFDCVMICNGHYTRPLIPDIKNLNLFQGEIIHSRDYRVPDNFTDKQVIVLGAGPSAIDISIEIAQVASKVMLSCKTSNYKMPQNISVHSPVVSVCESNSKSFITASGEELECDVILLCSGYLYDFPFLDSSCGITVKNGKYIYPLYRHVVNANKPNMVFIGIPFSVCPFPQFDCQIRYCLKTFKGEIKLPSLPDMLEEIRSEEDFRKDRNIPLHHSHKFGDLQWSYNKKLADECGISELIKPVIKKVYDRATTRRVNDPANYKYDNVSILNRENFQYEENAHKNNSDE